MQDKDLTNKCEGCNHTNQQIGVINLYIVFPQILLHQTILLSGRHSGADNSCARNTPPNCTLLLSLGGKSQQSTREDIRHVKKEMVHYITGHNIKLKSSKSLYGKTLGCVNMFKIFGSCYIPSKHEFLFE